VCDNLQRFPHVFTSAISDIGARTWVPCSDSPRERCTWDLELVAPRILASATSTSKPLKGINGTGEDGNGNEGEPNGEDDEDEEEEDEEEVDGEWPISVIASGELIEQVVHPDRSDRVIWHFAQVSPVSVQQIGWAVGPFIITEVQGTPKAKESREGAEGDEEQEEIEEEELLEDQGPKINALCLPGREEEMEYSVGVLRRAMEFYTTTFGSYPFATFTVAFVDSLASGSPNFHSAAMTLISSDILHPPSVIDQAYETRHLLAHALAVQWSGVNLIPRTPSDSWLVIGIALHMTSLFLKSIWGNNEYRFRLKKDMSRCVEQDIQFEPICVPARLTAPEPSQMQFIALKAPLVLNILDKHLRKSGTSLGLDKVLPKIFLDAITSDMSSSASSNANTLGTTSFMRLCRKACGGSSDAIQTFFDQWVYGSGCPTFEVTANFNRKKMAVELNVTQRCYAYAWSQKAPWEAQGHLRPIPLFDGQMTIRIHEADGTPYEHVLSIQDQFKRHEVPFNTKYKRVRRNTKRYQARQAAATAAALGDTEAQEEMNLIDVGFSLGMWEDEKERERWRVADWTEEDDVTMSQATYEWIRIDSDLDWICTVKFSQPDFMWISQLQRDRDVIAQLEVNSNSIFIHYSFLPRKLTITRSDQAIHALSGLPSPIVSSNLCKTVLVSNYFVRIRMEAALALITVRSHFSSLRSVAVV
jgi:transcription initiation factor TFIID subunit 2